MSKTQHWHEFVQFNNRTIECFQFKPLVISKFNQLSNQECILLISHGNIVSYSSLATISENDLFDFVRLRTFSYFYFFCILNLIQIDRLIACFSNIACWNLVQIFTTKHLKSKFFLCMHWLETIKYWFIFAPLWKFIWASSNPNHSQISSIIQEFLPFVPGMSSLVNFPEVLSNVLFLLQFRAPAIFSIMPGT